MVNVILYLRDVIFGILVKFYELRNIIVYGVVFIFMLDLFLVIEINMVYFFYDFYFVIFNFSYLLFVDL